jgi:Ca2+-transporting ATPase
VVMVTGDSERTAIAIGREVGLLTESSEILNSKHLPELSDQELLEKIDNIAIFARSTPEDKLRIVNLFRSKGYRVAVTGDGVNDAPALTVADVGIAMGISGTDVAKESADIVLTDDNFSSIVAAVSEGRVVYDNIMKATRFLLVGNLSELVTIFGAALTGLPNPLTAAQILWINLVTDGLPALALAADPKDPKAMDRKPRSSNSIFSSLNTNKILTWGLLGGVAGIAIFVFLQQNFDLARARTLTFSFIVLFQMVVAFSFKNNRSLFSNPFLLYSIVTIIILQVLVTYVKPFSLLFGG